MATEIIPVGTTAVDSSPITLVAGTIATFALKDELGTKVKSGAYMIVMKVSSTETDNEPFEFCRLTAREPVVNLNMNGDVIFRREAGVACGLDQD